MNMTDFLFSKNKIKYMPDFFFFKMKVIPNYVAFSFIICTAINTMYSRYSRCMVVLLYQSEMDNRAINPICI